MDQIKQVEATKIDGRFVGESGAAPEQGQEEVQALLERAYQSATLAIEGYLSSLGINYSCLTSTGKARLLRG